MFKVTFLFVTLALAFVYSAAEAPQYRYRNDNNHALSGERDYPTTNNNNNNNRPEIHHDFHHFHYVPRDTRPERPPTRGKGYPRSGYRPTKPFDLPSADTPPQDAWKSDAAAGTDVNANDAQRRLPAAEYGPPRKPHDSYGLPPQPRAFDSFADASEAAPVNDAEDDEDVEQAQVVQLESYVAAEEHDGLEQFDIPLALLQLPTHYELEGRDFYRNQ